MNCDTERLDSMSNGHRPLGYVSTSNFHRKIPAPSSQAVDDKIVAEKLVQADKKGDKSLFLRELAHCMSSVADVYIQPLISTMWAASPVCSQCNETKIYSAPTTMKLSSSSCRKSRITDQLHLTHTIHYLLPWVKPKWASKYKSFYRMKWGGPGTWIGLQFS